MAEAVNATNPMREVRIDKLVINIGSGSNDQQNNNAKKLLEIITGARPTYALAKKRNPTFKTSKGSKIGAFVTLRGAQATQLLPKLFAAVDNRIRQSCITNNTVNFGIKEYIDISGIKYDPSIGMLGMNVNISFRRPGLRTELKKRAAGRIKRSHRAIGREELAKYLGERFKVEVQGV